MPNNDGNSYRCYLPKVEKAKTGKPVPQVNLSSMVMESVKKVELKTPDELLEGLKDQCFVRVSPLADRNLPGNWKSVILLGNVYELLILCYLFSELFFAARGLVVI